MAKPKPDTRGRQQADGLVDALSDFAAAPLPGSRDLFILRGLKPHGGFVTTQENVLLQVVQYLADTGRLFCFGDGIVFEVRRKGEPAKLIPLSEGTGVVTGAEHHLSNLIVCAAEEGQFAVPTGFGSLLLRSELLRDRLPEIKTYAQRPVFDNELVLRGPGWHPEVGILVHGPRVDPVLWRRPTPGSAALARLPRHLHSLLKDFCFKAEADLANALALLLTVLLVGQYVGTGKPIALIDGNQPGLGKSLFVRVLGMIADGIETRLVRYTADEEELHKRICAHLRAGHGSVIALDNAKVPTGGVISSPTLESLVTDPSVALRILGKSELFERPNDIAWCLTMNSTKASADLVSRGLPIRFEFQGDPAKRPFDQDPVAYARKHRVEILAELIGMVTHWTAVGRTPGKARHRFREWASEVGGILDACGFPEFLGNLVEASGEFSAECDELTALADYIIGKGGPGLGSDPRFPKAKPLSPRDWVVHFEESGTHEEALAAAKSVRGKEIKVGNFLAAAVGKTVQVTRGGKPFTLTLKLDRLRANAKLYYFAVNCDGEKLPTTNGRIEETTATPQGVTAEPGTAAGNTEVWD